MIADLGRSLLRIERQRHLETLDGGGLVAARGLEPAEGLVQLIRIRQQRESQLQHPFVGAGLLAIRLVRGRLDT